ncbi:PhnD/SsuA/transferrin family substrate-binding protein [Bowmanella dokdonensis]|uniref:PhnD/SsuA/transferrin family substrate-binding protein n=1 Tax=Bowmanella dokdonensis TaxID=751969 RepID=A0A939DQN3_9ALTE|nr:PhnD/SsuA/transferrin family substrate-binding protein [Bowmanella dokdonensis]
MIATYAYAKVDRTAAIKPLADYLGTTLDRQTRLMLFDSPSDLINMIGQGKVDIAVPNLLGYLQAASLDLPVATAAVPDVSPDTGNGYRSVLIASPKVAGQQAWIRDTHELRLALVWRDSTSGGLMPRRYLAELGFNNLASAFARVIYSGSHDQALQAVLTGKTDLAGLASGVYDLALAADSSLTTRVQELWRSPPIPVGPVLCRLATEVCDRVSAALLSKETLPPSVMEGLNRGWPEFGGTTQFKAVDAQTYQPFIELMIKDAHSH